ncbi:MAG: glycosyltransferase, partial [Pyrinomonadaceae bacterium]|nr:glycosyltransferase [Pyrinomonadaceae bacterium]
SIGAVGSMLIYPDGRLQEAGGGVWIDGTAFNYGHRQDPEDRKFNYRREVDYCSASSLLVRKDLFERLGGFDARYAPAYYEDTDLCFGIRSLGFKVMYQPMSRVIHYEGITAGTDINAGFKRYQEINRHQFVEKWKETLRHEHLENDPDNVEIVANRRRGPRILVFDKEMLMPDRDSGSLRMQLILKSLTRRWRPVFIPLYASNAPKYEKLLGKDGIEVVELADYKRLIKEGDVYAVILSRAAVADALLPTIRKLDHSIKIIFDTVDVHFLRLEREYELTGNEEYAEEAMLLKKQETHMARLSDQVWCVTEDDKKVLEREAPGANFEIIPNIHALHGRGKSFAEREGLLFIGNFNHRPNNDAVHFFMKEILPRLKERIPGVKFHLVGSNMSDEVTKYNSEDVVVMGYVPDVAPLFHSCRVFVSPLRYGGGMKGKIGQAISYGLPVVTTAIGAEGMGLRHNHEALIADETENFIEAVCQAYTDAQLWQRLADNGYRHIQDSYTPRVVEEKIRVAIEQLGKRGEKRDKHLETIENQVFSNEVKADSATN